MVRKKTTTGWWEGELQAKGRKRQIGWFPASYVKLLGGGAKGRQDDQPSPLPALQPSPSPQPQASSPPTQQNNIEKVVALYQYAAQNEDELTFEKDDVIVLLAKEEPSWWRGELNGVSGLFPSNYVSPLCKYDDSPNEQPAGPSTFLLDFLSLQFYHVSLLSWLLLVGSSHPLISPPVNPCHSSSISQPSPLLRYPRFCCICQY
uniref:SH3 domain-containing protein n=1 Tax=Timema poppense TaxID=170557 RepID=A0A7R9DR42_TIMPO|nr:unnamed protein product [Timema poppensis]